MRIDEFSQPIDDKLNFDVIDDVAVFMRNDPQFYRKNFFPAIDKMKSCVDNGTRVDANKMLGPVVDKACEGYCQKFNVNRTPADLFDLDDRQALIQRLYSEEMENIKKGAY
jgi:hypothetical protein